MLPRSRGFSRAPLGAELSAAQAFYLPVPKAHGPWQRDSLAEINVNIVLASHGQEAPPLVLDFCRCGAGVQKRPESCGLHSTDPKHEPQQHIDTKHAEPQDSKQLAIQT